MAVCLRRSAQWCTCRHHRTEHEKKEEKEVLDLYGLVTVHARGACYVRGTCPCACFVPTPEDQAI